MTKHIVSSANRDFIGSINRTPSHTPSCLSNKLARCVHFFDKMMSIPSDNLSIRRFPLLNEVAGLLFSNREFFVL